MGILNLTPDSFSDGGRYTDIDTALYRVEEMLKQGMDILDIGGESTRPGYTQISEAEEIDRVITVISRIKSSFDVPVSLDTYKSEVAKAGLEAGVDIINDIWGLKYDEKLAKLIATANVPCIIMHNRKEEKSGFGYHNFITDVINDLKDSLRIAQTPIATISLKGPASLKSEEVLTRVSLSSKQARTQSRWWLTGTRRQTLGELGLRPLTK